MEGAREQAELLVGRGAVLEIISRAEPDERGITRMRARLVGYV